MARRQLAKGNSEPSGIPVRKSNRAGRANGSMIGNEFQNGRPRSAPSPRTRRPPPPAGLSCRFTQVPEPTREVSSPSPRSRL